MKLSSRKTSRTKTIELSMTSMIDVVFLLLIFFMVTTVFVDPERNLASGIQVQNKSASSPSDLEPAIIEIVDRGGVFVYKLGSREFSAGEEEKLVQLLGAFDKADGAFVRVSDGAPFGMSAAAIQACKDAKFTSVSYVPKQP